MFEIEMDPDVYRLAALTILFFFFTVAVVAMTPAALPASSDTPTEPAGR